MIARAPGKLVLSGAYAVLEGAPALVAAVDRYAVADTSRPPVFVGNEVREALREGLLAEAPYCDVSALFTETASGVSRKIGIGSSAAVLVASLAAAGPFRDPEGELLRDALFQAALRIHRAAQGGGSGVDVAASTFGGILAYRLAADGAPSFSPHALPPGVHVTVLMSHVSASTSALTREVKALAAREPRTYRRLLDAVADGAAAAATATEAGPFVDAIARQQAALDALGQAAGAAIYDDTTRRLYALARQEDLAFGPSGAGGGDVCLIFGDHSASDAFLAAAAAAQLAPLPLTLGAKGVHFAQDPGLHEISTIS